MLDFVATALFFAVVAFCLTLFVLFNESKRSRGSVVRSPKDLSSYRIPSLHVANTSQIYNIQIRRRAPAPSKEEHHFWFQTDGTCTKQVVSVPKQFGTVQRRLDFSSGMAEICSASEAENKKNTRFRRAGSLEKPIASLSMQDETRPSQKSLQKNDNENRFEGIFDRNVNSFDTTITSLGSIRGASVFLESNENSSLSLNASENQKDSPSPNTSVSQDSTLNETVSVPSTTITSSTSVVSEMVGAVEHPADRPVNKHAPFTPTKSSTSVVSEMVGAVEHPSNDSVNKNAPFTPTTSSTSVVSEMVGAVEHPSVHSVNKNEETNFIEKDLPTKKTIDSTIFGVEHDQDVFPCNISPIKPQNLKTKQKIIETKGADGAVKRLLKSAPHVSKPSKTESVHVSEPIEKTSTNLIAKKQDDSVKNANSTVLRKSNDKSIDIINNFFAELLKNAETSKLKVANRKTSKAPRKSAESENISKKKPEINAFMSEKSIETKVASNQADSDSKFAPLPNNAKMSDQQIPTYSENFNKGCTVKIDCSDKILSNFFASLLKAKSCHASLSEVNAVICAKDEAKVDHKPMTLAEMKRLKNAKPSTKMATEQHVGASKRLNNVEISGVNPKRESKTVANQLKNSIKNDTSDSKTVQSTCTCEKLKESVLRKSVDKNCFGAVQHHMTKNENAFGSAFGSFDKAIPVVVKNGASFDEIDKYWLNLAGHYQKCDSVTEVGAFACQHDVTMLTAGDSFEDCSLDTLEEALFSGSDPPYVRPIAIKIPFPQPAELEISQFVHPCDLSFQETHERNLIRLSKSIDQSKPFEILYPGVFTEETFSKFIADTEVACFIKVGSFHIAGKQHRAKKLFVVPGGRKAVEKVVSRFNPYGQSKRRERTKQKRFSLLKMNSRSPQAVDCLANCEVQIPFMPKSTGKHASYVGSPINAVEKRNLDADDVPPLVESPETPQLKLSFMEWCSTPIPMQRLEALESYGRSKSIACCPMDLDGPSFIKQMP